MKISFSRTRYNILFAFISGFVILSFFIRIILFGLCFNKAGLTLFQVLSVFCKGFIYDLAVGLFITIVYSFYLLILPQQWNNKLINKALTYAAFFIFTFIITFSFVAEIGFWLEFESRFNFIAVDYLIYTYEVINNIKETYNLPFLLAGIFCFALLITWITFKRKIFTTSFQSVTQFKKRAMISGSLILITLLFYLSLANSWADNAANTYKNELSKAGIFSFFAAFKNNELDYNAFYLKEDNSKAFSIVQNELHEDATNNYINALSIKRQVNDTGTVYKPNVIMITIESFSADFMNRFGNTLNITPNLDSLANNSMLFTDMYATGTRTVRGMEALTLSIPPTPGNSIVRRNDNENLYNIGSVFKNTGYNNTFFYGGDGYFDNMNDFFGNNGFNIIDRGQTLSSTEKLHAAHTTIADEDVHFKNAWGICDEDLYAAVIKNADEQFTQHQLFFDFVMTTSNHKPYTYPVGKIDIKSGSGRNGAVKYTDYAIGQFINKIKNKPWFNNTVIVFVADHCASSAGKNEINISKYHIPCIIYNLKMNHPDTITKQCSQIDIYPTLFGLFNWKYQSNFYGKNVLADDYKERSFLGTYQKLGYMEKDKLVTLSPQQKAVTTLWNKLTDDQSVINADSLLIKKAIAFYQTAYTLYKNGGMKENK